MEAKQILSNQYTVFYDGNIVKTNGGKIVFSNLNGYLTLNFKGKTYYVHRLVAQAFLPNCYEYPCVNHINGNKLDNRVENLEWCTYSHNTREAYRLGLKKPAKETSKHRSIVMLDNDKKEICIFKKMKNADKLFNTQTSPGIKRAIETGTRAYGFYWRYL